MDGELMVILNIDIVNNILFRPFAIDHYHPSMLETLMLITSIDLTK